MLLLLLLLLLRNRGGIWGRGIGFAALLVGLLLVLLVGLLLVLLVGLLLDLILELLLSPGLVRLSGTKLEVPLLLS